MKRLILFLVAILCLTIQSLSADCRGCCSNRGGLICENGITKCIDGSSLSQKCITKGCNVCPVGSTQPSASGTITIASFNIQVFGVTKASKPNVMEVLSHIVAQFDIVAIQEIRDDSGTAIKSLEDSVDKLGTDYSVIVGPRLGRTSSKEQYAFLYRTSTIEPLGSYTYRDVTDKFHREPFIAHFKVIGHSFDFILVNIHTDPDDAKKEIDNLPAAIINARANFYDPDVILLGDLNADGKYYNENDSTRPLRKPEYIWLIGNSVDTNVSPKSSKTYDRIIITEASVEDYVADSASVYLFDKLIDLYCRPEEVSDHYPVFSKFAASADTN